jgi:hypothetical protein
MINKKMNSLKKSIASVYNKFTNNSQQTKLSKYSSSTTVGHTTSSTRSSTCYSSEFDYCEIDSKITSQKAASSSGYGTSIDQQSTQSQSAPKSSNNNNNNKSVFINLDNYFYDENFIRIIDRAQQSTKLMKQNVINYLLEYQIQFLSQLKNGLENYIRPLGSLMDNQFFFQAFQNIEKIFSITDFIRSSINQSLDLTHDVYTSTLTILHEYISIFISTYELYLKGYVQSTLAIKNSKLVYDDFDLLEFVDLPVINLVKIYCAFVSLLDMTPSSEQHDHERISLICSKIKKLITPQNETRDNDSFDLSQLKSSLNTSLSSSIISPNDLKYKTKSSSHRRRQHRHRQTSKKVHKNIPNDYVDLDGNKYYFI